MIIIPATRRRGCPSRPGSGRISDQGRPGDDTGKPRRGHPVGGHKTNTAQTGARLYSAQSPRQGTGPMHKHTAPTDLELFRTEVQDAQPLAPQGPDPALIIIPPTLFSPGVAAPMQNMVLHEKTHMGRPPLGGFVIKAARIPTAGARLPSRARRPCPRIAAPLCPSPRSRPALITNSPKAGRPM